MNTTHTFFIAVTAALILCPAPVACLPQVFQRKTHEELIRKEYTITPNGTLTVENVHGNIHITTQPNKKTITLSATKKASNAQKLAALRITDDKPSANTISIRTAHDESATPGTVDYALNVPSNLTLKLVTREGSIDVSNMNGSVFAKTVDGDITLNNIHNSVKAFAKKSGSISMSYVDGIITTSTHKGDISIVDPGKNVQAQVTLKGAIDVQCSQPIHNTKLCLESTAGNIALSLPHTINADFQAKAEKGKVECEHKLRIKSYVTTLDDQAWSQFKKEVNAVLGSNASNTNHVKLHAKNGNISVQESNPKTAVG